MLKFPLHSANLQSHLREKPEPIGAKAANTIDRFANGPICGNHYFLAGITCGCWMYTICTQGIWEGDRDCIHYLRVSGMFLLGSRRRKRSLPRLAGTGTFVLLWSSMHTFAACYGLVRMSARMQSSLHSVGQRFTEISLHGRSKSMILTGILARYKVLEKISPLPGDSFGSSSLTTKHTTGVQV